MALTLVLSIGLDAELLSTRNFVLQSAGYIVVSAYSMKEAVDRFRGGDFDLVLLCHSIPTKERNDLICWIRAFGSRIPLVFVSGRPCQRDDYADATVESDPNCILVGISEVLINAATPTPWTPASCHKKDAGVLSPKEAAAAQGKKSPQSATAYERQGRTTKERSAPLVHAG